jgi:DNA-binding NarL/FixJ family response regulator
MVCAPNVAVCDPVLDVDAIAAWSALLNGHWEIVEHVRSAPFHTILCRLSVGSTGRLLSRAEIALAMGRARGAAVKALAADSGRSMATVSRLLTGVRNKLKLCSESQLAVFFDRVHLDDHVPPPVGLRASTEGKGPHRSLLFLYPCPDWTLPPSLSDAERIVVMDLIDGASPHHIARMRGTSPRTVANQISAIFRKLGVGSRVELFAALRPRPY